MVQYQTAALELVLKVLIPALMFCRSSLCVCVLQSKDIGVQMHEELVKVTNELYTVSPTTSLALSCCASFLLATFSSSLLTSSFEKQKVKVADGRLQICLVSSEPPPPPRPTGRFSTLLRRGKDKH